MGNIRAPRIGTMQFWPRKRAEKPIARIRSWVNSKEVKLLGFAGYKVGMTSLIAVDNRSSTLTKGQEIFFPVTIIECPSLKVASIIFYKNSKILSSITSPKMDKELARKISIPKKESKKLEEIKDYDDLRLLVYTQPKLTTIGKKKPELFQIAIGGNLDEKLSYAKEHLDKEINITDFIKEGQTVDIHSITKGKGVQGPVKRFGVSIRRHKSEKTKRGVGSLGPWRGQGHIMYRVAHAGQTGYHQRFEHNKQILKISSVPSEINSTSGFKHYGIVKNNYILLKGSVAGSPKRTILFTESIRPNKKIPKEAPTISYIRK